MKMGIFTIMKLNFKSFGEGDPVIILHGLFGMLDNWQTIGKSLAENNMVYLVDQRNHGKSPHFDEHNYKLMAEDLAIFLEDNWIHKAHLIGHSMGGKTVMQFAADFGDVVEKLAVIDIAPKQSVRGHDEILAALTNLDLSKIEKRSDAEDALGQSIKDRGVMQFLLKNLSRKKEGGYRWKMNLSVLVEQYERILDPITFDEAFEGPCLFLKGERSRHIQADDEIMIKKMFPNVLIKEISDAGHWVHADKPKETTKALQEFLAT